MTLEIGFLFAVLAVMVYLFLTEKLPVDLTAFLGLVVLVFTGYVTADEAFDGFASSAVITMLSIFILSASLLNTGVADLIGGRIHRWVGSREVPLIVTVMVVGGVLSAFMNNIAATAVLMPAVASLGRNAGISPSRLFMPLAFGSILGGTTTLVGTPPNILAGAMLRERGLDSFELFDFTPMGLAVMAIGTLFMATVGRRLLPSRETDEGATTRLDLARLYELEQSLFSIHIPTSSRLDGETLAATRLGTALGIQIVAITRDGNTISAPGPETVLRGDDELLVQGSLADLERILRTRRVEVSELRTAEIPRPTEGVEVARFRTQPGSLEGRSLRGLEFRERFGVVVLGIEREGSLRREGLAYERLRRNDRLFAMGPPSAITKLAESGHFELEERGPESIAGLSRDAFFVVEIPAGSPLVGETLGASRMGELMGLTVVAIHRAGRTQVVQSPDEVVAAGDRLLVTGRRSRITGLAALGDILIESGGSAEALQSDTVSLVEATVAPRSSVIGKTLKEIVFRDRYGLQALALWREGEPLRQRIAEIRLRVGDALLLQGDQAALERFAADPDFVVLSELGGRPRRTARAPFAIGGLLLMIGLVVSGFQPIQVAAFAAATLVVLSGALTMQEVYRAVEWRAIFLVAAVLPVGAAMERSGAAGLLASSVIDVAGPLGPYAVLGALILLSSVLSQGLDGAPAVVLLTPVALQVAEVRELSPYPLMMGVGLAASAAFMTPFSHKANLLVMGLGGYRSMDYVRVGTPLTVVLLALLTFMVPVFFPF